MITRCFSVLSKYKPYYSLMRLNSVYIVLLALFPGWTSIALAAQNLPEAFYFMSLFFIGALVMRPAGCIINDIFDRNFDGKVERTKNRPLACGQITVKQALIPLFILLVVGLIILLLTNLTTVLLGTLCLIMAAFYPLVKRFFWWPQLVLGLTFNMGALMGWTAIRGHLSLHCILLYIGCVFWTLGYDTIYAHQDKKDDVKIGIKSTAIHFGSNSRIRIKKIYFSALTMWLSAGVISLLNYFFYIAILAISGIFYYQYKKTDFDNQEKCMYMFKVNIYVGLLLFLGVLLGKYLK